MHLVPILAHCLLVSKAGQSLLSLPSSLPVLDFSFTRLIVEDMAREGKTNNFYLSLYPALPLNG
jgi:hypothetical protein